MAGLGIPVMAAMTANLSAKTENPVLAMSAALVLASLMCIIALFMRGLGGTELKFSSTWIDYGGGVFLAFYLLSATVLAPKLGVGNFVALILIGQLIMAAIIDQTGWFGMPTLALSKTRFLGLLIIALGIGVTRIDELRI